MTGDEFKFDADRDSFVVGVFAAVISGMVVGCMLGASIVWLTLGGS